MNRPPRIVAAWAAGGAVYLAAAITWGYDGLPSLVLLPVCSAIASAAVVGLALLAGLPLCRTPLGRLWRSHWGWAGGTMAGSLAVLCLGSAAGLTDEFTHPDTGERFQALHPAAALAGYFALVFAAAHWPASRGPGRTG